MGYSYEYEKRLHVGYIGGGEYSYRNILPAFRYAPIDLVALVDTDKNRGLSVARQFGARHFYPNHKAMLAKEEMDAVFIVVGLDAEGHSRYPELADESLRAGFHTWIGTPPCTSSDDITTFTNACLPHHKYLMANFKKMFMPAYIKAASIIQDPDFGGVSTFSMRYPLSLPTAEDRDDDVAMAPFLEFVHPYSLLLRLFGECEGFTYMRSTLTGGVVMNIRYSSGLVGTLHLTGGQSLTSPLERLEIVGNDANLVVENGIRLLYYRPGGRRGGTEEESARQESFIGPDDAAPIIWEPEFSLGRLYNKQLFLQGYVGSITHFAQRILQGEPPVHGNLVDILHIMNVYDNIRHGQEDEWITAY
ncbi:MAG: Gfo/Idh/MocA family oxidoreductase [Chloroflexota bacterium]|nr:Gfo/Idh/MocA family oxidoreductase [Chloroflexota bacterium]